MRFRNIYMILGTFLVTAIWLITDPASGFIQNLPYGAGLIASIVILLKSIFYVGALHLSRRALMDYLNLQELFLKAKESSNGAGLATVAVGIMMIAIAIVIHAATA